MNFLRATIIFSVFIPILFASFFNIRDQIRAASSLRLAKLIENSGVVALKVVESTLRDAVKSGVTSSCEEDISRSVSTLYAYLLNQQFQNGSSSISLAESGDRALAAINHRLLCSPADGNAWLMRAQILQVLAPNSDAVVASLARSYQFAPAEFWIMEPRFNFAMSNYDLVEHRLMLEFTRDLNLLVEYAPASEIGKDYLNSNNKVRAMIYQALDKLPRERRDAVVLEAKELGATIRSNQNCAVDEPLIYGNRETSVPIEGQQESCGD